MSKPRPPDNARQEAAELRRQQALAAEREAEVARKAADDKIVRLRTLRLAKEAADRAAEQVASESKREAVAKIAARVGSARKPAKA
jgi:hypothetical protein